MDCIWHMSSFWLSTVTLYNDTKYRNNTKSRKKMLENDEIKYCQSLRNILH